MKEELLKVRIEELAGDRAQRDNALALIAAFRGTVLAEIDRGDIEINGFTNALCFYWKAEGEWEDVSVEISADQFETYLSRDQEVRINHWPVRPDAFALKSVVDELLAGMA